MPVAIVERFIPDAIRARGAEHVRQARLSVWFGWGGALAGAAFSAIHLMRGSPWVALTCLGSTLCFLLAPFLLRQQASIFIAGNFVTLAWLLGAAAATFSRGGIVAPAVVPSLMTPLLATLLVGRRSGVTWAAVCTVWLGGLLIVKTLGIDFPDQVPPESNPSLNVMTGAVFMLVMLGIGLVYEHLKNAALQDLRRGAEEARLAHEERVRAEAEAKVMFADRMAAIGRLSAGVAHEINNPLAYVLINLQLMRDALEAQPPRFTPDLIEAVDEALQGAVRVRAIVSDLKTFSRAEDESLNPVDVHEVLDSVVRMVDNEAHHRAKLVKDYGDDIPHVAASESRLAQVFLNLLMNAIQAIPVGRAQDDQIRVTTRYREHKVTIEVADTGVGVPDELIERVMEPFFTTKPVGQGTGLGLSVSRSIVERFGGTIAISSRLGRGTTVTVVLKAVVEARAGVGGALSAGAVAAGLELRADGAPGPRARLLIIDDDVHVAKALARLVKEHETTIVCSGEEALALLARDSEFDAVFCDLMIPDLTGMEIYERVRQEWPALAARMVFISGGVFTGAARQFVDEMSGRFLEKPFDKHRVVEVLERAGVRRRAREHC